MNTLRLFAISAVLVVHFGCATLLNPPRDDADARRLLEKVVQLNAELERYKALANVSVQSGGQRMAGRVAMAAAIPDRIRIEWLSAIGQPVTRLVGDGHQISIFEHGNPEIRRVPQTDTALESLIHLPVGITELQSLLTGQVELPEFVAAQMKTRDDRHASISLMDRWHRVVAVVDLVEMGDRLKRIEYFDADERPIFAIQWSQWQKSGNYQIPKHAILSTRSGRQLALSLVRFWPDVELPDTTFTLKPPGETP